jgi:signal transduction histidine kinase
MNTACPTPVAKAPATLFPRVNTAEFKGSRLYRYTMALLLMGSFLIVSRILFSAISYNPVIFIIVGIVAVSWMFGSGPGVMSSLLVAFGAKPLFYPKVPWTFDGSDLMRLFLYLLLTGFVSYLVGARRKAEQALLASNAELDERVRARTAQLTAANEALQEMNSELTRERTKAEASNVALRRANADLEQFAYSASHDLQEPIRNVAIHSQLLSIRYGSLLDHDGKQYLEYVREGADRMGMLVRDLLAYTRTVGQYQEPVSLIDANVVMDSALANLDAAIRESSASISRDALPCLEMHEVHLQQILQNLIGNAIKYRSENPPRIKVEGTAAGEFWHFTVRDNGIGIDEEYREKVFGIFTRLHPQDQYPGTGMGLAICQRIVERYDGRIWVESEQGSGAAFHFTIRKTGECIRA